jgi:hypothetical protein
MAAGAEEGSRWTLFLERERLEGEGVRKMGLSWCVGPLLHPYRIANKHMGQTKNDNFIVTKLPGFPDYVRNNTKGMFTTPSS